MAAPTRRIANQNPYHRARSMPSHRPPPPPDYLDYLMAEDRYYHRYYAAQALSQGHQHQPEDPSAFGRRINTPLYYQPQQRPPPPPSVPMCHHITAKQPPKPKPVVHTLKNSASCQPPKPLKLDPEMPSLEPRPLLPTHQHLSAAQQRCQPVKEPKFGKTIFFFFFFNYLPKNKFFYFILQLSLW